MTRTLSDILVRAFSLLLLADRGLLERESHSGGTYSLKEREDKREEFQYIFHSRALEDHMSLNESSQILAPVGQLSDEQYWTSQYQYEAIPVLLWAVNLYTFPSYDPKFSDTDFHPILGRYRTERWMQKLGLRCETEIQTHYGVVFLWHWRSREGITSHSFKIDSAFELVRRVFGDEFKSSLPHIRTTPDEPSDFEVGQMRYSELDERSANTLNVVSKWRHHALEWVIGEDPWEETETNT